MCGVGSGQQGIGRKEREFGKRDFGYERRGKEEGVENGENRKEGGCGEGNKE